MAKNIPPPTTPPEAVISIIGAGMTVVGDTDTDGSLRIEGTIRGSVRAGKSVVVGRDGLVDGSVFTQDAVVAGKVSGEIHAESRLELQATGEVSGEIVAPRMQVEEGARVQGQVAVGAPDMKSPSKGAQAETVGGGRKIESQTEQMQLDGRAKADDLQTEPEPEEEAERQTSGGRQTGSELDQRQQQLSGD